MALPDDDNRAHGRNPPHASAGKLAAEGFAVRGELESQPPLGTHPRQAEEARIDAALVSGSSVNRSTASDRHLLRSSNRGRPAAHLQDALAPVWNRHLNAVHVPAAARCRRVRTAIGDERQPVDVTSAVDRSCADVCFQPLERRLLFDRPGDEPESRQRLCYERQRDHFIRGRSIHEPQSDEAIDQRDEIVGGADVAELPDHPAQRPHVVAIGEDLGRETLENVLAFCSRRDGSARLP
jgi:hypothetical protein